MINYTKNYNFNYDDYAATVKFVIDTSIFTDKEAKQVLDFFSVNYNNSDNLIDEVMRIYALEAIKVATRYSLNKRGVIEHFSEEGSGWIKVDGSFGIKLFDIDAYEFLDERLDFFVE